MNRPLLPLLALALGFSLACSGGSAPDATTPPPPPPADGSIGVPACDDYIKKVDECVGKLNDATAKAAFESSNKQTIDAWRQAAATPAGKGGLETGCKMALDMFKCPEMPAMPTRPVEKLWAAHHSTASNVSSCSLTRAVKSPWEPKRPRTSCATPT